MDAKKGYFWFFIVYTIIILIASILLQPIKDVTFEETIPIYFKIRFWQFIATLFTASLYYWFFVKEDSKFQEFYIGNRFYCSLIYFITTLLILFTIHFLNTEIVSYENQNGRHLLPIAHKSVKIWEVGSYLITTIYTVWLWYFSDNGTKILDDIEKDKKRFGMYTIGPSLLFLLIIVGVHSYIIFSNNNEWLKHYGILLTLFLIILTYIIFNSITKQVVKTTKNLEGLNESDKKERQTIHTEFKSALKFIERPTLIIFCIMFAYATYCSYCGIIHEMETFFSGAIAFELLLSSIVWANTDTV